MAEGLSRSYGDVVRIRRHGSHLIQLTRYAAVFPMNCYLVVEEDGLTMIDSTTSAPTAEVAAEAERLGLQLRRIALTHAHGDHVGGVAGIRERFTGIDVAIGERDARLLAGDKSLDASEPKSPVKGYFVNVDWKPDRLLKPGDRVGSLDVVAAPGHTPGHIAFFDRRDRSLIAGDALQTRGGVAVSGVLRPLFPFVAMATWHKQTALATAESLRRLEPSCLAIGHGDVLADPGNAMDAAVEAASRAFA